jgi:hypothetical protein
VSFNIPNQFSSDALNAAEYGVVGLTVFVGSGEVVISPAYRVPKP